MGGASQGTHALGRGVLGERGNCHKWNTACWGGSSVEETVRLSVRCG